MMETSILEIVNNWFKSLTDAQRDNAEYMTFRNLLLACESSRQLKEANTWDDIIMDVSDS